MLLWLLIWEKNCIQTYNCLLSCPVPAGRRCCGRGRRPPRGWCWGPGRSTAGLHPLGWPSRWSVRRSTCLPRRVACSSAVWRFSLRCWGSRLLRRSRPPWRCGGCCRTSPTRKTRASGPGVWRWRWSRRPYFFSRAATSTYPRRRPPAPRRCWRRGLPG